tara:strand:- start:25 stop:711 length:687 start_codon:yes stop_codon:yes gene_type:complete
MKNFTYGTKQFDTQKLDIESVRHNLLKDFCLCISIFDRAEAPIETDEDYPGEWWYAFNDGVTLVAPYEEQTEWSDICCPRFIASRMAGLNEIGKMKKPTLVPEDDPNVSQIDIGWPWDHEVKPIEKEIGYKPSMRRMRSWMKMRKSDVVLWNYYLTGGEGIEPKMWHDDYTQFVTGEDLDWYSDLPGYDDSQGVYMSDGVYATESDPEIVIRSISNPDKREVLQPWDY